jgi:hypothetical protein
MDARPCEKPGCNRPIFQQNTTLCQIHKIEQQHEKARDATARKLSGATNAVPGSKPIKKNRLYNFKLDGETKSLKRKRTAPAGRSISDNALPVLNGLNVGTHPQKPSLQRPASAVSDISSFRQSIPRSSDQRGQSNVVAETQTDRSPIEEEFRVSLGSASMAESPISLFNGEREFPL